MTRISIKDLKKSPRIIQEIRWEVTPRIFLNPPSSPDAGAEETIDITHGYMLYVDLFDDKPVLEIMQLKRIMSKTVGYVYDIPEELLKEAMLCTTSECIAGMYPLSGKLEGWLKKEFGLS